MALIYVGSMPLSALVPSVYLAIGQVAISLNAALQGNLALNASLSIASPTLGLTVAASVEFLAQLAESLTAVPPVPQISFDLSACASLNASLLLSLDLLVVLEGLLDAAIGIYAYGYEGAGNALGPALTSALATAWPDGAPTSSSTTAFLFGAATDISQRQTGLFLDGLRFGGGLLYAGKIGLSALSVVTASATSQGRAGIQDRLAATAALTASLGVRFPNPLVTTQSILAYQATLFAIPSVSFMLAATASAAASISVKFGLLCKLGAALERFDATLFVYSYTGAGNALGPAVTTALATTWGDGTTPASGACTAAILGATDAFTIATMGAFFGGA